MKRAKILFIILVALTSHLAWTAKQTNEIKKAKWLIGTWENKTQRGSIYETWSKERHNTFSGRSYRIKEQDTIVFETIQLVEEARGLFYIPTVKNQNDALPVRFTAKTITETQMVFENREHDFPQIISYTKITADSLIAEISGSKNGRTRQQTFPMKRISIR